MNAHQPSLADGLPHRRFTVAEVVRMVEIGLIQEDERLESLDGEIVEMSPKGYRREGLKGAIIRLWGRQCPPGFDFIPETGLYLSDMVYLEPDFVVFPDTVPLRDLKGPDVLLAIEVADGSLAYDLTRKPAIYASFGVRELWVIDVARQVTHRFRDGLDGVYATHETAPADQRLQPVHAPGDLAFTLADLARRRPAVV